jgi:F-type H+-transporting ATPase subunit delta
VYGAVAAHYANALADAVFKPSSGLSPEDAVKQLRAVDGLFSESKLLERALLSPAVKRPRKEAVIARIADDVGLNRLIKNLLLVIVSHRRTSDLSNIRREFEKVVDERLGWIPAEIASAKELDAQQKQQIERTLGTRLGKFIRAQYTVDPDLLGGIRARVASREYDATLRGTFEQMRHRLLATHE